MRNLYGANLRRLVRGRAFRLAVLAELGYTLLIVLVCWDHYDAGGYFYTMESILSAGFGLMGYLSVPSLIAAPMLTVYLGTEYSDKTLRNKLIVGHTRSEIYLADLLCCVTAAVGLDVLYLALAGTLCVYPVLGMAGTLLRVSSGQMTAWICAGLLARAAWTAVIRLTAAISGNKTSASVAGLLLVVLAMAVCICGFQEINYCSRNLNVPGNDIRMAFWQLVMDTMPTGQYFQLSRLDTPNLWRMPLLSLGVLAGSTGAGLILFERKDLK